jgi:hypothetical protein
MNGQHAVPETPQHGSEPRETPELVPPPEGLWQGEVALGSITSPSETGKYRMVLRDYSSTAQVEGSLVALDYVELDGAGSPLKKTVLCQVSHMRAQNIHHENRVLGALLREKGRIPGLSGFADHKEVDLLPMDTLAVATNVHQLPRNIPPMGTDVRFASVADVQAFSGSHKALFNIGYLYETRVPLGLMLKHFGPGDDGWGDAHMLGVFGVSGSGKTVMAASIVGGFSARHEMGMLIVDPQGQFSGFQLGQDPSKWSWRLDEAFRLTGRGGDVQVINIDEIALESPLLFAQLLERYDFFDALTIMGHEKKEQVILELSTFLTDWLRQNPSQTLGDILWGQDVQTVVCAMGASAYADPAKQVQKMLNAFAAAPYKLERAGAIWETVRAMFSRRYKLGDLLDNVLLNRKIVILNVDADEAVKDLYCSEILYGIKRKAESIYRIQQGQPWRGDPARKYRDVNTNALIVIDEAHRFAPQAAGANSDQDRIVRTLVDAIKTTRKLGVGWCYITQSIASFNKEIFRQIQTKVIGVGIGTGADNDHLESAFNHDADLIARYRAMPRPITTGVFPFAVIGELVALGNGSRALFVSAPSTQQDLFDLNPNHFTHRNGVPVSAGRRNASQNGDTRLIAARGQSPDADGADDIPF